MKVRSLTATGTAVAGSIQSCTLVNVTGAPLAKSPACTDCVKLTALMVPPAGSVMVPRTYRPVPRVSVPPPAHSSSCSWLAPAPGPGDWMEMVGLAPVRRVLWVPLAASAALLPLCVSDPPTCSTPAVSRPVVAPPPKLAVPVTSTESSGLVMVSVPPAVVLKRLPTASVWPFTAMSPPVPMRRSVTTVRPASV